MKFLVFYLALISLFLYSCTEDSDMSFKSVSSNRSNIDFKNIIKESEDFNIFKYQYFYNGGGVAIADLDNDGLQDVVFTGNFVKNRIYKNIGDLEFQDMTRQSTISDNGGWSTGVTTVDVNSDGLLDIYICRAGFPFPKLRSNLLYINKGNFRFEESAEAYGLDDGAYSTKAVFFDYDLDGDLDAFIANHSQPEYSKGNLEIIQLRNKSIPEFGNKLFENVGGVYRNVTAQSGITSNVLTFSLDIAVSDINNDTYPDLYITNDFNEPDYLFINNGIGGFEAKADQYIDVMPIFSMGVDIADINNDQRGDIVATDMLAEGNYAQKMHNGADNYNKTKFLLDNNFQRQYSRNMLHLSNSNGSYTEMGQAMGVSATDWSWSPLIMDFDNDGSRDLFISNGYLRDHTDMDFLQFTADEVIRMDNGKDPIIFEEYMASMPPINESNYFFKNSNKGSFTNIGKAWGWNKPGVTQGAAYGDLDNDGDLDLVINNSDAYGQVIENKSETNSNNYIRIQLEGPKNNSTGIGSKIIVYSGLTKWSHELFPARGFQSSKEHVAHFGLGEIGVIDSVVVLWPGGGAQVVKNVSINQLFKIKFERTSRNQMIQNTKTQELLNLENVIDFVHKEDELIDFDIQGLMPFPLSRRGPHMSKGDFNKDGLLDVVITGGMGQSSIVAFQQKDGSFKNQELGDVNYESIDVITADFNGDEYLDLYFANGSYEQTPTDPFLGDQLYFNNRKGGFIKSTSDLPNTYASCITDMDVDGDGDIDLFLGSYVAQGKFPISSKHHLLINDGNGKFSWNKTATEGIEGMITDAIWQNNNLIVAGEWMPLSAYHFEEGRLLKNTAIGIPDSLNGYFKTIEEIDWDNDGDKDLIIGNLGTNSIFKATPTNPLMLHYGDFDNNGSVDPLISNHNLEGTYPIHSKEDMINQLPFVRKKFNAFSDYANAAVEDILNPEQMSNATMLQINELKHLVLVNKGNSYEMEYLDNSTQYAPLYAIEVLELSDNTRLIFTGGNEQIARVKIGSLIGNDGLVLESSKEGFQKMNDTGIIVKGDVRDIETIPYKNGYLVIYAIADEKIETYYISSK